MDNDNKKFGYGKVQIPPTNAIFFSTAEHVEQLKAVYRRDWQKAWTGNAASGAEIQEGKSGLNEFTPNSQGKKSVPEMFAYVEKQDYNWRNRAEPPKRVAMADYFANHFDSDIEQMKTYCEKTSCFNNLDQYQFFHPGLYVIGATPTQFSSSSALSIGQTTLREFPSRISIATKKRGGEVYFTT